MAVVGTQQVRYYEKNVKNSFYIFHKVKIATVKNYNLNVTEVRDSDFKNAFPGIFNYTVGILIVTYPICVKICCVPFLIVT